jgi:hypothetical protein
MKLWEKPSEIIFRILSIPYRRTYGEKNLEGILKKSLLVMDANAISDLKNFVRTKQTLSGGFADKAGNADLYYTLFGYFLTDVLELKDIIPSIRNYIDAETRKNDLTTIHLHCLAILSARLGKKSFIKQFLKQRIHTHLNDQLGNQPAYSAFLGMLTCYYLNDYKGFYMLSKRIKSVAGKDNLPCSVLAALLVLQQSFKKPVDKLKEDVFKFYDKDGGFKATQVSLIPDLLTTAVALYALKFANFDLNKIKPECYEFVDSLYQDGGFGGNRFDPDTDIEYTFYGLLALGALAE